MSSLAYNVAEQQLQSLGSILEIMKYLGIQLIMHTLKKISTFLVKRKNSKFLEKFPWENLLMDKFTLGKIYPWENFPIGKITRGKILFFSTFLAGKFNFAYFSDTKKQEFFRQCAIWLYFWGLEVPKSRCALVFFVVVEMGVDKLFVLVTFKTILQQQKKKLQFFISSFSYTKNEGMCVVLYVVCFSVLLTNTRFARNFMCL